MRKLLFAFALLFLISASSQAQQDPLKSNYRFNYFLINPAAAGSNGQWTGRIGVRSDFTRIPGSAVTSSASFHGVMGERSGVGINMVTDVIGPEQSTGIQLNYAYHIDMDRNNLSIGLGARYVNYRLNDELVDIYTPEPLNGFDGGLGDLALGVMHYSKKHYVGISVPQLIQITGADVKKLTPHIYLSGGYIFDLGSVNLEPMLLAKIVPGAKSQVDVNLRAWFVDNQLMLGAGWRGPSGSDFAGSGITLMTGFNVKNKWQFTYSYDMNTGDFQSVSWGSHEVGFGVTFGKQKFDNVFGVRPSNEEEPVMEEEPAQ